MCYARLGKRLLPVGRRPLLFAVFLLEIVLRPAVYAQTEDFGDAPAPYSTLISLDGARHAAAGPVLGTKRDTEADGLPSSGAKGDDLTGVDDEDGVSFGTVRAGALDAQATVGVSAAPGGAVLDAWIDFNADGSWGGAGEQIAAGVTVSNGINVIEFDVPNWARPGTNYSRFRLSAVGSLGLRGAAADGEVEDHPVAVQSPVSGSRSFASPRSISADPKVPRDVMAVDLDNDGDMDALSVWSGDHRIVWHDNDGNQSFTDRTVSTEMFYPHAVSAADVDGDGDTDMISGSALEEIAWHENDGSQNFTLHIISTNVGQVQSVCVADVDGDGDIDVLSASSYRDEKIAWYENDGSQNFTLHIISTNASQGQSVCVADVDGDGDIDVLSASYGDDKIAWYQNDGNQHFTSHAISTTADGASSVFAADMDGDGDMDVVAGASRADAVLWYENDGAQAFAVHTIADNVDAVQSVCVADMDGDGDMDVLSASENDHRVAWYENDAEGFVTHTISTAQWRPQVVAVGDMDSDGDLDVMACSSGYDWIAWYVQDKAEIDVQGSGVTIVDGDTTPSSEDHTDFGTGVFSRVFTIRNTSQCELTVTAIAVSGLNATDFSVREISLPIIVGGGTGVTFRIDFYPGALGLRSATVQIDNSDEDEASYDFSLQATGTDGDFGDAPTPYPTTRTRRGALHMTTGPVLGVLRDAEGDGLPSPAATDDDTTGSDDEDGVSFGPVRAGALGAQALVTVANAPADARLDAWLDFNADGTWGGPCERVAAGLLVSNGANVIEFDVPNWVKAGPTFSRFRLSTAGGLGPKGGAPDGEVEDYALSLLPAQVGARGFSAARFVDTGTLWGLDGAVAVDIDGDGDMDVLSLTNLEITWHENDGSLGFTRRSLGAINQARDVFAADVDGDGDVDVLSASWNDNEIAWCENDGSQNFAVHSVSRNVSRASAVFAADVDGDGDMDILSAAAFGHEIAWHENDGSQSFTEHTVGSALSPYDVFAADVDSDGDMDVLSAAFDGDKVLWYENDGSQTFTTHTVCDVNADGALSVFSADMDGDGDMDVLSGSCYSDTVAWHENDGSQNFTTHDISRAAAEVLYVSAADMDGDGDMDVLSASYVNGKVAWYENDGSQNFTERDIGVDMEKAKVAMAADMDGDGDMDILAGFSHYATVAWYEQTEPEAEVQGNGTSIANNDTTPSPADHTDFGTNTYQREFTIVNTGVGGLNVDAITLGGGEPTDFFVSGLSVPTVVPSRASVGFSVGLYPTAGGRRSATVRVTSNDHDENPFSFVVEGTGFANGDLGDAPASYATTRARRGALHAATGPMLGSTRDTDADGRPHQTAAGDDGAGSDDEDGVSFGPVRIGAPEAEVTVNVTNAPGGARLDAWLDFDGDGTWAGPWERIAYETAVSNGTNMIAFNVPVWAKAGASFGRFRLSTDGGYGPAGAIGDGEVEDHLLHVLRPFPGSRSFARRPITTSARKPYDLFPADVDGDGDVDVLAALAIGTRGEIVWYENEGRGTNFTVHTISANPRFPQGVFADDIDGDGDMDVLSASAYDDRIAWYENSGSGSNFVEHSVSTNAPWADSAYAVDMDADGDMDVLSSSATSDRILWHENDGAQSFRDRVVSTVPDKCWKPFPVDLDRDGDMDVLCGTHRNSRNDVLWLENDGNQGFSVRVISDAVMPWVVRAVDLDSDGDLDVLSSSSFNERIDWYENDGNQNFRTHILTWNAGSTTSLFPADLDGDGDMDVMSASYEKGKVAWYENDGSQTFTEHVLTHNVSEEAASVVAADVDGDRDLDIIYASRGYETIAWYEQRKTVLVATAGPHGSIDPGGHVFVEYGGATNFAIMPDAYCYVADVRTNGTPIGPVSAFTWSNVTAAGTVEATFGEDCAALGTPQWWLAHHGWTHQFDAAETNNPDLDPHMTWQEYLADTDPTNPLSCLRIHDISCDPPRVHFRSSSNRVYSLESHGSGVSDAWTPVIGQTNIPGIGGADHLSDTNGASHRLYRLSVGLPLWIGAEP